MNVSVHEAKTHLSRLLVRVEAGDEVVINRAGTPVARLVRVDASAPQALLGALRGKIDMTGFDDPLPEDLLAVFEGHGA